MVGPDNVDAAHAWAALSFLLQERFLGRGYATEAAARHPATLNPRRATAKRRRVSAQPSTAAVQEGLLREFARKGNAFQDVVMMALLRKEWPPAQKLDRAGASLATQKALSRGSATTTGRRVVKKLGSDTDPPPWSKTAPAPSP